jgi:hypothetical protein
MFFEEVKAYPAASFGAMSMEFYKWSELSRQTKERWDTRFNHLWMLPMFLVRSPDFTRENWWIIDYVGKAYAKDFNERKPELMFIDRSPELSPGLAGIDLPAYFGRVEAFRQAFAHYRLAGTIDACVKAPEGNPQVMPIMSDCRFDVYRRLPPS